MPTHNPERIHADSSKLLVIDLQERLVPALDGGSAVVNTTKLLAQAAKLFGVPTTATEQYPRGLGPTVAELALLVPEKFEKSEFSAAPALGWPSAIHAPEDRFQIILAGAEAHVCVLQTALDLAALGYQVVIAADAVASRRGQDCEFALKRLRDCGIVMTTAEAVVFEWCTTSARPEFKSLSALVKSRK